MLTVGGLKDLFSDVEKLALLVSCLSHDLDHRGFDNSFQAKVDHPLARLYTTSTMEYHHFNQCVMLIQSQGCEIFSRLCSSDYEYVIKLIQHAIISTDLAVYFRNRKTFFSIVDSPVKNWKTNDRHKELLSGAIMTGSDISAITRPWKVQKKIAKEIQGEFYEQGDFEKTRLNTTPKDNYNREMIHKFPKEQIGFIDFICLPLYQALVKVDDGLQPLLDGCLGNRRNWEMEAEGSGSTTSF